MRDTWSNILATHWPTADKAEALCRLLAPVDLARLPLYVLGPSDIPEPFHDPSCYGYFNSALDLQLQDELTRARRWRGRGIALAVQVDDSPGADPANVDEFFRICLHELGHGLATPRRPGTIATLERNEVPAWGRFLLDPPARAKTLFEKAAREREPDGGLAQECANGQATEHAAAAIRREAGLAMVTNQPERRQAWRHHGPEFIRTVCHLAHRARRIGFDCSAEALACAGWHYGLSEARFYVSALGDEPERRQHDRIAEIVAGPPPLAFLRLFERDAARYRRFERGA